MANKLLILRETPTGRRVDISAFSLLNNLVRPPVEALWFQRERPLRRAVGKAMTAKSLNLIDFCNCTPRGTFNPWNLNPPNRSISLTGGAHETF